VWREGYTQTGRVGVSKKEMGVGRGRGTFNCEGVVVNTEDSSSRRRMKSKIITVLKTKKKWCNHNESNAQRIQKICKVRREMIAT